MAGGQVMEKVQPIVELRVVQKARQEDGELVFTSYTLQSRTKHDPVWRDVPVIMKVEGDD
jgi:hypothetical protein